MPNDMTLALKGSLLSVLSNGTWAITGKTEEPALWVSPLFLEYHRETVLLRLLLILISSQRPHLHYMNMC